MRTARLGHAEPAMVREQEAASRVFQRRCSQHLRWLAPGVGHICLGKTGEGSALLAAALLEIGTAAAVGRSESSQHPGVFLSLVALQDLWVYGVTAPALEWQLATTQLYVPQDTLAELLVAPWNPGVLRRPDVWAGILVTSALAATLVAATDVFGQNKFGGRPNLFGREFSPAMGYPLAGIALGGLFTHVAIAEETLFRGYMQSGLARHCGQTCGWALGSAVFGLAHALNIVFLESKEERDRYLMVSVPIITAAGGYLGASYHWNGYSLTAPVALHFWYDLIVSLATFVADPQNSSISARLALPF